MSRIDQLGPWPARLLWVVLAVVALDPLQEALADRSGPVRTVALVLVAAGWTAALVAMLVPRTSSLTALRFLVPAGLATTVAAAVTGDTVGASEVVAVTVASLAVATVLSPWFTESWVDGSSYGAEHRLPLQTPPLLAAVVAPLTWVLVVVGTVTGPLLLAAEQWIAGMVALVLGALLVRQGVRSLHQLSRRWVVMVPTGMVLHDPLTLPEPHLFLRTSIDGIRPAEVGTEALDLTAGASGLVLELVLGEPVDMLVRTKGRDTATEPHERLLFTPARPAHLLERAREHRIPVG